MKISDQKQANNDHGCIDPISEADCEIGLRKVALWRGALSC